MNSKEKSHFLIKLRFDINKHNYTFENFIQPWNTFEKEDINSLILPIVEMCQEEMASMTKYSTQYFEYQNILKYLIDSGEYKPDIRKFTMTNAVKAKEIVKIFMRLNKSNFIRNTNEEIAMLISTMFEIEYKLAYNYLKNPGKTDNTKDLLG